MSEDRAKPYPQKVSFGEEKTLDAAHAFAIGAPSFLPLTIFSIYMRTNTSGQTASAQKIHPYTCILFYAVQY